MSISTTGISGINAGYNKAKGEIRENSTTYNQTPVFHFSDLVNIFSQEANKAIGDLAEHMRDKASTPEEKAKWGEGGEYKALLHAVVGGLTSSLSGNGFASGAVGDGLSQLAQRELYKITDKNLRLIASAAIGAAAAKAVGCNAKVGAGVAYNGVKYNDYKHRARRYGEIVYVEGQGFSKVNLMGTDVYQQDWYPEPGQVYWKQNPEDQSLGWEYVAGTGREGDPYKEDTYIASWKSGYAYDPDDNQIIINGKGIFNPNALYMSEEERKQILNDVGGISGGVKIVQGAGEVIVNITRTQQTTLSRLTNLEEHLTDMDFSGTLRDLKGNPVPKLDGSGFWNHLQEMKDTYRGLLGVKRSFEGTLNNPNLASNVRGLLQGLDKANTYINKIEELFKPYGGIK